MLIYINAVGLSSTASKLAVLLSGGVNGWGAELG